jgi:hypothetical protein
MEVWIPYGNTEAFIDVTEEEFGGFLEPEITIQNFEWMEKLEDHIEKKGKVVIDPVLLSLEKDPFVTRLYDVLQECMVKKSIEVIIGSNVYPFYINIENILKKYNNIKPKLWQGSVKPDVIISSILPHPIFGFSGAPYLSIMGELNFNDLIIDPTQIQNKVELNENNLIQSIFSDIIDPSVYSINIVPYKEQSITLGVGEIVESYNKSIKIYKDSFKVDENYTMLVVSVGGFPYDSTILSLIQSLINIASHIKDGGELILLSECGASFHESHLIRELIGLIPIKDKLFLQSIKNKIDEVTKRISIRLVSTLPHIYSKRLGFKASDTASFAFQIARRRIKYDKSYFLCWGYHVQPH